jgi:hypothetical protein
VNFQEHCEMNGQERTHRKILMSSDEAVKFSPSVPVRVLRRYAAGRAIGRKIKKKLKNYLFLTAADEGAISALLLSYCHKKQENLSLRLCAFARDILVAAIRIS